jgi:hypothetical protein
MICKNCSTKMREIAAKYGMIVQWCPNCGTLNVWYRHAEDVWEIPKTGQLILPDWIKLVEDAASKDVCEQWDDRDSDAAALFHEHGMGLVLKIRQLMSDITDGVAKNDRLLDESIALQVENGVLLSELSKLTQENKRLQEKLEGRNGVFWCLLPVFNKEVENNEPHEL